MMCHLCLGLYFGVFVIRVRSFVTRSRRHSCGIDRGVFGCHACLGDCSLGVIRGAKTVQESKHEQRIFLIASFDGVARDPPRGGEHH